MERSRPSTRLLLGRRRKKLQRHHQRGVFTVYVFCLWPFDNVFPLKGLPDQRQHTLQTTFPSLRTLMPPSTGSQSLWWTSNMNQKTLRAGISLHRSGNHPSKRQKCLIRSILHRIRPTVLWSICSKKEFGLGQVSFITHSFIGQALIFVSDRRLRRKTLKLTSPLWVLTRRGFPIMKKLVVVRLMSTRTRMLTNRELLMKMSGHETSSPHTYFQHYGWSLSDWLTSQHLARDTCGT